MISLALVGTLMIVFNPRGHSPTTEITLDIRFYIRMQSERTQTIERSLGHKFEHLSSVITVWRLWIRQRIRINSFVQANPTESRPDKWMAIEIRSNASSPLVSMTSMHCNDVDALRKHPTTIHTKPHGPHAIQYKYTDSKPSAIFVSANACEVDTGCALCVCVCAVWWVQNCMFHAQQRHHQRHNNSMTTAHTAQRAPKSIDSIWWKCKTIGSTYIRFEAGPWWVGGVPSENEIQNEIQSCVHYDDESNCETINNDYEKSEKNKKENLNTKIDGGERRRRIIGIIRQTE